MELILYFLIYCLGIFLSLDINTLLSIPFVVAFIFIIIKTIDYLLERK